MLFVSYKRNFGLKQSLHRQGMDIEEAAQLQLVGPLTEQIRDETGHSPEQLH